MLILHNILVNEKELSDLACSDTGNILKTHKVHLPMSTHGNTVDQ